MIARPHLRRSRVVGGVALAAVVVGAIGVAFAASRPRGGGALGPPTFIDETAAAGVDIAYGGDANYVTGGGVAVLDCDGDGRPDLYVAGGAGPAALFHNDSVTGGALRFSRRPSATTDLSSVLGAYPLDVDGDGHPDLAVLRGGQRSVLLRGLGDCRFTQADDLWGATPATAWTTAFSATWEASASLPTLAFGNYVDPESGVTSGYRCFGNQLIRPDPSGARYAAPIPLDPGYCALSMLFSDWDGSGRRDLRVSNDRQYYDDAVGEEQLWRIAPGEAPRPYGPGDGWRTIQIWGMGIASQDLTGDGRPEIYLTSQGDNKLQTLASDSAQPAYRDIALSTGVIGTHPAAGGDPKPSTAWHPEFEDVNNDGFVDLYVSKGNVDRIPDYAARDPSDLFVGQPDGTFVAGAERAGIVNFDRTRGAALADLNLDGLLDLVEVKLDAPVRVWRNVGSGSADAPVALGSWLAIRLVEPGPDVDAIGAKIDVRAGATVVHRELTVGGGHLSGQLGWTHVGLGPAGSAAGAEVRVTWPDGQVGPWLAVQANQFVTIDRATGTAAPWTPTAPSGSAPAARAPAASAPTASTP